MSRIELKIGKVGSRVKQKLIDIPITTHHKATTPSPNCGKYCTIGCFNSPLLALQCVFVLQKAVVVVGSG